MHRDWFAANLERQDPQVLGGMTPKEAWACFAGRADRWDTRVFLEWASERDGPYRFGQPRWGQAGKIIERATNERKHASKV